MFHWGEGPETNGLDCRNSDTTPVGTGALRRPGDRPRLLPVRRTRFEAAAGDGEVNGRTRRRSPICNLGDGGGHLLWCRRLPTSPETLSGKGYRRWSNRQDKKRREIRLTWDRVGRILRRGVRLARPEE